MKGIEKCVDCNIYLVEELPPEQQPEFIDLVTVFIPKSSSSLLIAKSGRSGDKVPCKKMKACRICLPLVGSVQGSTLSLGLLRFR